MVLDGDGRRSGCPAGPHRPSDHGVAGARLSVIGVDPIGVDLIGFDPIGVRGSTGGPSPCIVPNRCDRHVGYRTWDTARGIPHVGVSLRRWTTRPPGRSSGSGPVIPPRSSTPPSVSGPITSIRTTVAIPSAFVPSSRLATRYERRVAVLRAAVLRAAVFRAVRRSRVDGFGHPSSWFLTSPSSNN
jgi:hypothetical protein